MYEELRICLVQITGGSSGIGKAVAVEVIKRGASITLIARDEVCGIVFSFLCLLIILLGSELTQSFLKENVSSRQLLKQFSCVLA